MNQPTLPNQDFSAYESWARFSAAARVRVHDAMARMQAERIRVCRAMESGQQVSARVLGRGSQEINRNMAAEALNWRDLESIRSSGTIEQLAVSLPNNAVLVEAGLRMTSVWHYHGLDPDVRLALTAEDPASYFFGYAPVQMKIAGGDEVLLDGPIIRGEHTVIAVRDAACVRAARGYWDAVRATIYPCAEEDLPFDELTERQRRVVALMLTCSSDEQIARRLGTSVRTVRTEVATVLALLDAPTRFVAGVRLRERMSGMPA
ncbi:helix-turn-helix transcriptional regulator [Myceligenerans crystallogenes]|uniref:HTH luxR-type domain-containing protein n=1 Tax=Myceligenerans crystallogenes TaxID=316335 RepID=A0ABN2NG92_9MICO